MFGYNDVRCCMAGRVPIVFYTSLCVLRGDIYYSTRPLTLRDVMSSLPASHLIVSSTDVCLP